MGDDPSVIASGITTQDYSSSVKALSILRKYKWDPIESIENHLLKGISNPIVTGRYSIISNARQAIDAAKSLAERENHNVKVISYTESGEASIVAKNHAKVVQYYKRKGLIL